MHASQHDTKFMSVPLVSKIILMSKLNFQKRINAETSTTVFFTCHCLYWGSFGSTSTEDNAIFSVNFSLVSYKQEMPILHQGSLKITSTVPLKNAYFLLQSSSSRLTFANFHFSMPRILYVNKLKKGNKTVNARD